LSEELKSESGQLKGNILDNTKEILPETQVSNVVVKTSSDIIGLRGCGNVSRVLIAEKLQRHVMASLPLVDGAI
jgi:hypothetical protein